MKGIVSALGINSEGILAAGTFARCVSLYGSEGRGGTIAVFSVAGEQEDIGGRGITQLLWSPCGRYLHAMERMSNGAIVYDIRVAGKRLGLLKGRTARTNQRLSADVVATARGYEIWAGGTDGLVSVWSNPHENEKVQEATFKWKGHDGRSIRCKDLTDG